MSANASWAGRCGHTTVIDAAGNIYVMGGVGDGIGNYFNDVWVGTNKGANRTQGYSAGTQEVLTGYTGGTQETLKGAQGVLKGCSRGTRRVEPSRRTEGVGDRGVLEGCSRGTAGASLR